MGKKINCLVVDGGGVKGIVTLQILANMEKEMGINLNEHFKYMTGASTGALIVTMLKNGMSAQEILDVYIEDIPKIFNKKWWRFGIFLPKYKDKAFNKILTKYSQGKRFYQLEEHLLLPQYNYTDNKLEFYKSYEKNTAHEREWVMNILRSSASAQTYFKPWHFGSRTYIDAGNICNSPTLALMADVSKFHDSFNILSLGTGQPEAKTETPTFGGGLVFWISRTVNSQMNQAKKYTDYIAKSLMPKYGEYVRVEPTLYKSSSSTDDASDKNILDMLSDGEHAWNLNKGFISDFIKKTK